MTDKKKARAATDSVKTQLASMTLRLSQLEKAYKETVAERDLLKKQNVELASVIENDLKADLKLQVLARGEFKEDELENLSVEQLQQINETLSRSKGADAKAFFKSIRAGDATASSGNLTVGNLYGKSRKEILEMGGDF